MNVVIDKIKKKRNRFWRDTRETLNQTIRTREHDGSCDFAIERAANTCKVKRHKSVHVKYQNIKGEFEEIEADDMLAICIQHENDHLDGIVFIERLSNLKKQFYKKKMQKEKVR